MFSGFYNLASGMITHGKHLDVISNNMANVATTGFKVDTFTGQTFDEVMYSLVGNKDKNFIDIGERSYATVPSQLYTDYTQGSFDETGMPLDFAIDDDGRGFFAIQTDAGIRYTRAGDFSLDEEGYLSLPDHGRVLDVNGEEIALVTDKISTDDFGRMYTQNGGFLGQIGVYVFEDTEGLVKDPMGMFDPGGAQPEADTVRLHHGMLERSNVGLAQQMVKMISTQRAYQSSATLTKMYDQVMSHASGDLGRLQ
ncbi:MULTISPECIES: flagellar hook-basal body protein [unclassified Acutalibacter]|jgi:flagellar basal-body rod protein FlgF|uniref:flagellar hook-basal body protein n=1 Tax=unclassified Acutalibacter TaxID=2620728 RepID=UPI0014135AE2|nr:MULTISPECIES: flagellar hook-basal body protein [unclassified Acutalibacter]MCI9224538.1 flagellar hook-basal body protein [Acutalibacter sp.]NBJ90261.1 flagellar hook-basal body protein [Acutalibacter sp. 1XD8-36]